MWVNMQQVTSPAAQVIISIIPITGISIGGIIVFFSLLWHHHEVKLQIKTGTYKKEHFNYKVYTLLIGILLTGIGFVLSLFFAIVYGKTPALLGGLIPLTLGICLIIFYILNPEFKRKDAD